MKNLLPILLILAFCAVSGFAADKPQSTAGVPASLVEVGKTYLFSVAQAGLDPARVVKKISDNWIQVQFHDGSNQYLNLQTVYLIKEETPKH